MSKRTSDNNQLEQSSNQKPGCGANLSNKRQRFTIEQARQLLLDFDSEDVLAGNYDIYDFKNEGSDVENSETDLFCVLKTLFETDLFCGCHLTTYKTFLVI